MNQRAGNRERADVNAAAAADAPVGHEPDTAHGHGEAAPTLSAVDWPAWIAGALGVAAGLAVIAAFYLAGRVGA